MAAISSPGFGYHTPRSRVVERDVVVDDVQARGGRHAYRMLHFGFVVVPLLAGLDKFFHVMTNWNAYLSPYLAQYTARIGGPGVFMKAVGGVEILAALIVAFRPKVGAFVVAAWLAGIIANLFLLGHGYDVALRDFGLMLGAIALGRLAIAHERRRITKKQIIEEPREDARYVRFYDREIP